MAIIVFQHHDIETPGRLGMTLRDHGYRLDIRRPDRSGSRAIPGDLDEVQGIIVMGGPHNLTPDDIRDAPWLMAEAKFIKQAHDAELPVIGVCLGAQLIAHALGGTVEPMPTPEVGFETVSINPVGQVDPILAGIAWDAPQFHIHAHHVTALPSGATVLASSAACENQAFTVGLRTFAFQFHFECDHPMIDAFFEQGRDLFSRAGLSRAQLEEQVKASYEMYARVADRLCLNLTTCLFPTAAKISA